MGNGEKVIGMLRHVTIGAASELHLGLAMMGGNIQR